MSVLVGMHAGGLFTYLTPLMLLVFVPVLDTLLGDRGDLEANEIERLQRNPAFRWILYAWVPVQLGLVVWGAVVVSEGSWKLYELVGIVWSTALCTAGVGITAAHELIHSARSGERFLGRVLLATVSYLHFEIEHVEGHHRRVATPSDPASARAGESLYAFLPRAIAGSFRSAWTLEHARRRRFLDIRNRMLWAVVLPPVVVLGFWVCSGPMASLFFVLQSLVAIFLLETVNYIEHYGLERERLGDETWEPVSLAHSWNADLRLSNALLLGLQRHSDHHLHPRRPYQALRDFPESPRLPSSYAGMIWLAAIPPLWTRVMDPRLKRESEERS